MIEANQQTEPTVEKQESPKRARPCDQSITDYYGFG